MGALAAGAIGSLITLLAGFAIRFSAVPRELAANDRRAREHDRQLEVWVADRNVGLLRDLRAARNTLAGSGALHSGEYSHRLGLLKESALHEYRDERARVELEVALIYEREGWLHDLWRQITRRPRYQLQTPEAAAPVLDAWRQPLWKHLRPGEEPIAINDPTARTLEQAVGEVGAAADDFA